ncbi:helix-turn-helix domain-containing protein [Reyranella sp.]|uniref:helix-turn-helix domain-containing protein n=1 Tax=Reyranella sp. TaxID=1929291 RepID=UPI002F947A80
MPLLPRDVKTALDLMKADPARQRSIGELAAACGVAGRTLQKHFRKFLGRTPGDVLRDLRLERVRLDLLRGWPDDGVAESAMRWGFSHLGRFAAAYRRRYGEAPSATVRRRRQVPARPALSTILSPVLDRPVVHVRPFELAGTAARRAATIADEIAAALLRDRWLAVGTAGNARYQLHGRIHGGGRCLRATVTLADLAAGRYLWADRWDGEVDDVFAFEEQVASGVATAVERSLRRAEVERVRGKDAAQLGPWSLTMRALPLAMTIEATALARALELLGRAMELAPHDALPMALAAWCHGTRGAHFFTPRPGEEKRAASTLARQAARLNSGDPRVEALLGAAHTLAHDLETATVHFDRALALDGGCVWAWNRSGWVNVYRGQTAEAIERFQIARSLDPADPLAFFCSIGIAAAHFEIGRYDEAAQWFAHGIAEHPQAVWSNRFRAPALALAGRREEARQSYVELVRAYPELTIAEIRSALPHTPRFYDRAAEGLASLGMR